MPGTSTRLTWAFLALVAWLPLPLGSNRPWAEATSDTWCFLLVGLTLAWHLRHGARLPESMRAARPVFILLLLYIAWLGLQMLPLSIGMLQWLSPHAAAIRLAADAGTLFAPITLDAHATAAMLVRSCYLVGLFGLTLYLIDSRRKLKWLVYTVLLSALFQALYGSFMILTGIEYSFFISKYVLFSHPGSATGTFASRDHLAGYLEMALAIGIGYMLSLLKHGASGGNWKRRLRAWSELLLGPKARLRLLLILLCLGLVLTHSRGGNIAFFASLGIAGVLFLLLVKKKPRATIVFLVSLIVLDIVLIGSWVGLSTVMTRLEQTTMQTEDRDEAYISALPMLPDYWLSGTGAGTFGEVFPAYKSAGLGRTWNHAHNDYLELFIEGGAVGFALLAGCVLYALAAAVQTLRRRRSSLMTGMAFASLMGIAAMLVHSFVDFNLQIPANSSMFMLLLALAMLSRQLESRRQQEGGETGLLSR
jgi:O-antigen ligase